jgi:hypothetical protein
MMIYWFFSSLADRNFQMRGELGIRKINPPRNEIQVFIAFRGMTSQPAADP